VQAISQSSSVKSSIKAIRKKAAWDMN